MPPLERRAWWFPAVFAVHNLEEALWLPAWSRHAGRFHVPVSPGEMGFAVTVLTLLACAVTAGARTRGGLFSHLAVGAWVMMLGNVVAPHLVATVALGRYAPGLATGVLLLFPVLTWLLVLELRRGTIRLARALGNGVAVGLLVVASIPWLFFVGRHLTP